MADQLLSQEFSRRCRRIMRRDGHEWVEPDKTTRRLVIDDGCWEIYLNEVNGAVDVGVCASGDSNDYARTVYSDRGEDLYPDAWSHDMIVNVCLPILRRMMVLDDLADV